MQIAKIENGEVVQVGHYRDLFPNISFPATGPTDEFLSQSGCVRVTMWMDHDQETQTLESTSPYLQDGKVYLVRAVDLSEEVIEQRIARQQQQTYVQAKADRAAAVERIIVTTASGKQFDGDEDSQNRMTRAILSLQHAGATQTQWKLADNTATSVTLEELKEALLLAGTEQTAVWMI